MEAYLMTVATLLLINVAVASSFNLVLGYAGLFSAAQAALYGVGAYVSALAMMRLGWDIFPALLAAALVTGLLGAFVGRITVRLGGHYLVIGTLALQFMAIDILANNDRITGGRLGLNSIPRPSIFGLTVNTLPTYLLFTLLIVVLLVTVTVVLARSPWGRMLRAMREDEIALASLGKNVVQQKVTALAIGSGLTGIAGALYGHYIGYIDPTAFAMSAFVAIMAMVIVGGSGTTIGPIVGAALLTIVPEIIRFSGVTGTNAGPIRLLVYATMLLLIVRFRPAGLIPERTLPAAAID